MDVLEALATERATAILRTDDAAAARPAMEAAVRGGFRVIEFTLTTPGARERISEFSSRRELVVGAGTVMDVSQAREAVTAGAKFLVSPIVDEGVIQVAKKLRVPVIPGCYTPAEMMRAHNAGAPLVKLFPGPADGPTYVRQVLGPLPFLKIVPTAGVDEKNARTYLDAGAFAVGFVSSLFRPDDMAAQRWDAIEKRARVLLSSIA